MYTENTNYGNIESISGRQYLDGYEQYDDGEEEVTGALVATRLNKEKAADDAKLLVNRIALLKLEEKKAWKKIDLSELRFIIAFQTSLILLLSVLIASRYIYERKTLEHMTIYPN